MTPEAALMVAVIVQAITDLDDPNPVIRGDANSFFFGSGSWAEMRRFYCRAVGVDPVTVQEQIRRSGKADPPPPVARRGVNPFTVDDLRAMIPPETAWQLADLPIPMTVTQNVKQTRLAALIKEGHVEKVGPTHYALTSLQHPWMLTNKERVLSVLEHRPMTTKEIASFLRPRLPVTTVWAEAERLCEEGIADKVGPGLFRLRRVEQIAA